MSFFGYEKPVEYTGMQIFDPTMAKMVLDALDKYFNAVYADYQLGLENMKEFNKEYGDFVTPILADQEWYNRNVTGKVRDFINNAYAQGVDLTRSQEGRAALARLINSIDVGSVAKLRSSAENAKEFLKARKQLEAQGLYNPLLAKYDGPDIDSYSTLDRIDADGNVISGQGIWDKMSPTRITDMATFGNPFFEGMKPNVHKASKNGIEYSIESITQQDLERIANDHFNELVSTPQGQLMYKYYVDVLGEDKARDAFNAAVAAGQNRRIYTKDDYNDNYFKVEALKNAQAQLALKEKQLELQALRNNILANRGSSRSSSSGSGDGGKTPVSYYEPLYQSLVVNTLNKDPMRSTTFSNNEFTPSMGESVLSAQRNIAQQYFGDNTTKDIYGGTIKTPARSSAIPQLNASTGWSIDKSGNLQSNYGVNTTNANSNVHIGIESVTPSYTVDPSISETKTFKNKFNKNYMDYLHLFSGGNQEGFSAMFANSYRNGLAKVDELSYQGKKIDSVKGQQYVTFSKDDINNIYSAKEISARMAGITGSILEDAKKETQKLRNRLLACNSLIMRAVRPIGSGLADVGQFGVYSESLFKAVNNDGESADLVGEFVYKTPFMSTPNPNAAKDGNLNLLFDLDTDLERKIMDNPAIRKGFGVSSNTGTIDNTLPDSDPWYILNDYDFVSDFDLDF